MAFHQAQAAAQAAQAHAVHAHLQAAQLAQLAGEYRVEELVLGFPLNMDGTEGPRAQHYRDFAAVLEETVGLKPVLWDEHDAAVFYLKGYNNAKNQN